MPLRSVLVAMNLVGAMSHGQAHAQVQGLARSAADLAPPTYRVEGYVHKFNRLLPCGTPVTITAQLRADPAARFASSTTARTGQAQLYRDFAAAHVVEVESVTAATSRDGMWDYGDFSWGPTFHDMTVEDRPASITLTVDPDPTFPPLVTLPERRPVGPRTPVPPRGSAARSYPTECVDDLPPTPTPAADLVEIELALRERPGQTMRETHHWLSGYDRHVFAVALTFRDESRAALDDTSFTKAWNALDDFAVAEAEGRVYGQYFNETETGKGYIMTWAPFRIVSVEKVPASNLPLPLPPSGQ